VVAKPQRSTLLLRGESTTTYASSKLNRVGRRAARYDSGLSAHRHNRPAHKRLTPHRIAGEQIACSRSRCDRPYHSFFSTPKFNPYSPHPRRRLNHARYDAVGNRLSSLGMSYNYNTSNELTSTTAATYTYDANGNTLTKANASGTTQYSWDFENRLSSVTLPSSSGSVTFKYDPFGRRIQKTSTQGSTSTVTNYLYDQDNLIEEVDANGNEVSKYTQHLLVDEPLAEARSSTTNFYEQDALDSITSLSSITGTISNSYSYDTYGNLTASTGSLANSFQYTGRDYDPETGLRFYRARYYDPQAGRFLSEDPEGFDADGDFYRYVGNDPANWLDPSGLARVKVCRQGLRRFHGLLSWQCHTYIRIVNDNGTEILDANGIGLTYGILGDPGSTKHQIPRKRDPRNSGKDCTEVQGCGDQINKLIAGMENAVATGTCPSCLGNYRFWIVTDLTSQFFDGYNSNTWVFNMLLGAGLKPPGQPRCPGYHEAVPKSGSWY
jgi:RHS repeat-associated protein